MSFLLFLIANFNILPNKPPLNVIIILTAEHPVSFHLIDSSKAMIYAGQDINIIQSSLYLIQP